MFADIQSHGIECFNINYRKILSPFALIKNLIQLKKLLPTLNQVLYILFLMPILVGMTSIIFNNNFKMVITLTGLGLFL